MAGNPSIGKTIKVLESISQHPEGITLTNIVRETKLPKSTVFDILEALYEEDAIFYKDRFKKTYVIGFRLFGIGQSYITNSNFLTYVSPLLTKFADDNNLIAYGCKRLQDRTTYVFKHASSECELLGHDVGYSFPLVSSIAGRVFLAYSSKAELNRATEQLNDQEKEKLFEMLRVIKENGYASEEGNKKYIRKYAVPVFNFENRVSGVISAVELIDDESKLKNHLDQLVALGAIISEKEGYVKHRF